METSPEIGELAAALAKAQGKLSAPTKNREVTVTMKAGGRYKFKYATLDHLIDHIRKAFTANGLWFVQRTEPGLMVTRLIHSSGQWADSAVPMPNLPNAPQEAGSTLTYFRRYSLTIAAGLASDEDDDANVAEGNGYEPRQRAAKEPEQQDAAPAKPPAWREPDSPYSTPTKLHAAVSDMRRQLEGCGDSDMVYSLCGTDQWREFARIAELHAPHYLHGGPPAPEEFEGLVAAAERKIKEFDSAIADQAMDFART